MSLWLSLNVASITVPSKYICPLNDAPEVWALSAILPAWIKRVFDDGVVIRLVPVLVVISAVTLSNDKQMLSI